VAVPAVTTMPLPPPVRRPPVPSPSLAAPADDLPIEPLLVEPMLALETAVEEIGPLPLDIDGLEIGSLSGE
jgi:hypothetical protein